MDRIVGFLNNKYFIAAVVGLFLLSLLRRFTGR
jgi:hypothetical protein